MIRGIKFVGIPVRDQDVALKFYTEAMGMKVMTDQPFMPKQRWIELMIPGADTGIALFTPEGHEKRIGEHPVHFVLVRRRVRHRGCNEEERRGFHQGADDRTVGLGRRVQGCGWKSAGVVEPGQAEIAFPALETLRGDKPP